MSLNNKFTPCALSVRLHCPIFKVCLIFPCSSISAALWCNCTTAQCEKTGSQCETDGACMASTSFIDGQEQHIRICITRDKLVPLGQPFFCRSAEGLLKIHCCYTDYCNSIDLQVPMGKSMNKRIISISLVLSLSIQVLVFNIQTKSRQRHAVTCPVYTLFNYHVCGEAVAHH